MKTKKLRVSATILLSALTICLLFIGIRQHGFVAKATQSVQADVYDVRAFGAKGDGKTLDTPAINSAIEKAASVGGGTVRFPAGVYLSVSIHLKSNITLYLDQGATIVAADPKEGFKYDLPEPNSWDKYQDFGHSHWHNSLIWGEGLENVSILGPGRIDRKSVV